MSRALVWLMALNMLLAGCQSTSTGHGYQPENCAMVGSTCSSNP